MILMSALVAAILLADGVHRILGAAWVRGLPRQQVHRGVEARPCWRGWPPWLGRGRRSIGPPPLGARRLAATRACSAGSAMRANQEATSWPRHRPALGGDVGPHASDQFVPRAGRGSSRRPGRAQARALGRVSSSWPRVDAVDRDHPRARSVGGNQCDRGRGRRQVGGARASIVDQQVSRSSWCGPPGSRGDGVLEGGKPRAGRGAGRRTVEQRRGRPGRGRAGRRAIGGSPRGGGPAVGGVLGRVDGLGAGTWKIRARSRSDGGLMMRTRPAGPRG